MDSHEISTAHTLTPENDQNDSSDASSDEEHVASPSKRKGVHYTVEEKTKILLEYNQADILNLKTLLDYAYTHLSGKLLDSFRARLPSGLPVRGTQTGARGASKWLRSIRLPEPSQEMVSQGRRALDALLDKLAGPEKYPVVVGIDLTGSAKRPSGWASLMGREVEVRLLGSDADLIGETLSRRPDLVSIDSPLSIPKGRHCTSDRCWCRRKHGIARHCERELWRRGVRVYPCLLPSMQKLTMRGIRLAKEFRSRGIPVIESYPGAAQDILRIPRKKTSLQELLEGIRDLGLTGDFLGARTNHDEMDAITSALVGYFFLAGSYEAVGTPEEDYLIIPKRPTEGAAVSPLPNFSNSWHVGMVAQEE